MFSKRMKKKVILAFIIVFLALFLGLFLEEITGLVIGNCTCSSCEDCNLKLNSCRIINLIEDIAANGSCIAVSYTHLTLPTKA